MLFCNCKGLQALSSVGSFEMTELTSVDGICNESGKVIVRLTKPFV